MKTPSVGEWGERRAEEHLIEQGYRIVERNWHARSGEIDFVASIDDTLVFVEVKTRSSDRFGAPEEALTASKRRRIQRTAWAYMAAHDQLDADWQVDVIAIERGAEGEVARLEHYRNALEAEADLGRRR